MDYVMVNEHLAIYDKMASRQAFVRLRTTYFSTDLVYCVILRKQMPRVRPGITK